MDRQQSLGIVLAPVPYLRSSRLLEDVTPTLMQPRRFLAWMLLALLAKPIPLQLCDAFSQYCWRV